MKIYKSLHSLIKDYRLWRGISQEKLAELIRISVRELRYWEANRYRARIENLHDLSEATGIPMEVCVVLNAGQPLCYSLQKRRYAYSSIEAQILFHESYRHYEQSVDNIFLKIDRISTDKHISLTLSCHGDIYDTEKTLQRNVIKKAIMLLPDLNHIVFDSWGHYVGHNICLPIKKDDYHQLKKREVLEDYLTIEKLSDILSLGEGVFFFYSGFATNLNVAHRITVNDTQYLATIKQKKRYLVATHTCLIEAKKYFEYLGMRRVKSHQWLHNQFVPKIYELELDVLAKPFGPWRYILGKDDRQTRPENLIGKAKRERLPAIPAQKPSNVVGPFKKYFSGKRTDYAPLIVGDPSFEPAPLIVGKRNQNERGRGVKNMEACPNLQCTLHGKTGRGNIILNGKYQTKGGTLVHRFHCKKCGTSFCSRARSIFYDLRTPEEKVLVALKLLLEGMPLRRVATALEVKFDTVQYWLKIVSEQSGKIDAMLKTKLKVSQVKLDALWTFVRENSLRKRASLWRTNQIHLTSVEQ